MDIFNYKTASQKMAMSEQDKGTVLSMGNDGSQVEQDEKGKKGASPQQSPLIYGSGFSYMTNDNHKMNTHIIMLFLLMK